MSTEKLPIYDFAKFEKEENLFVCKYRGHHYWNLLRFAVWVDFVADGRDTKKRSIGNMRKKSEKLNLVKAALAQTMREISPKYQYKEADMLIFYNFNKKDQDGKGINSFLDFWDMPKSISVYKVQELVNYGEVQYGSEYTMARAYLRLQIEKLKKKLFPRKYQDSNEEATLKQIEESAKVRFGISPSAESLKSDMLLMDSYYASFGKYYRKLIKKIKPKAILLNQEYYSVQSLVLIDIANKNHIPVIEFMHGLVRNHGAYCFEDSSQAGALAPDYFLTFGKWQTQWCKLLSKTREIDVGYPFQEYQLKLYSGTKCNEKEVVFYPTVYDSYQKFICEFADLATPLGYTVKCKFHPLQAKMWTNYYPILAKNKNIIVLADPGLNVYECIMGAKHHVLADTTTAYEIAVVEGRKMYIPLDVPHVDSQPFLDHDMAIGVADAKQLLQEIQNSENEKKKDSYTGREQVWRKNAKHNVESFFSQMSEQGWPYPENFKYNRDDVL
jgi:hypothetical protein